MTNHKNAQGSTEYLLILAAILVIAVVVVIVANGMLGTPKSQAVFRADSYRFAVAGMELVGYSQPFNGNEETAPAAIKYNDKLYPLTVGQYSDIVGYNNLYLGYLSYTANKSEGYPLVAVSPVSNPNDVKGIVLVNEPTAKSRMNTAHIGDLNKPDCYACCNVGGNVGQAMGCLW